MLSYFVYVMNIEAFNIMILDSNDQIPDPTIPAYIWITFTPCRKTWTLSTSALALGTVASSKAVLAALRTPRKL